MPAEPIDRSGTITAGGVAQQFAPTNRKRRGWSVENPTSSTSTLWVSDIATAVTGSPAIEIPPGVCYESPANGCSINALSIISTTTGQPYTAREW